VWSNLRDQLKNQRDFFTVPAFRKLEDFEEKPKSDTLLTKAGVIPVDTTKKLVPRDSPIVSSTPDPNRISAPEIPYSFMPGFDEHRPSRTGYPQPTLVGGNQALQEYIQTQGLFPDSARQANINRGFVMVEVIVDTSGNAIDFKIIEVQPENMGFEELALQAMRAMKYEPAVLEGVKVEGILQQPVMFIRLEE
jgi:TonB family protein